MAVAATRTPVMKRAIVVDAHSWTALVAHLAEHGISLVQVPCGPGQMPRYSTTTGPKEANTAGLTTRELEVLRRMAQGMQNAQIGRQLYVSEDTIKTNARIMFRKLGVPDRASAVNAGWRLGILGGAA